jgi:hypothetical protein
MEKGGKGNYEKIIRSVETERNIIKRNKDKAQQKRIKGREKYEQNK